jgi:hypothetical protein
MRILNQSPPAVQKIVELYNTNYNTLSGKGLFVDLKNKLDGWDLGGRRYWEFVVAQFKRAGLVIPAEILQNEKLERLEYVRSNDVNNSQAFFEIVAKPAISAAVPGTLITYEVKRKRDEIFDKTPNYQFQWYVLHDPEAVKNNPQQVPARFDLHNVGASWEDSKWTIPGNHKVICRVQINDRPPLYLEYQQTVLPSDAVVDDAFNKAQRPADPSKQLESLKTYQKTLLTAEQQPGSNTLDPQVKEQLQSNISAFENRLKSSQGMVRYPIKAVYLSSQDAKVIPLNVFIAQTENRIGSPWAGRYTWTIVDITNPGDDRTSGEYRGMGNTAPEAIQKAIQQWDSDNRYFLGIIKLEIPPEVAGEVIRHQFPTDGSSFWDSVSQFLDTVGFVSGIASLATAVNPVISVPLGLISIVTSTAGASIRLTQRRAEGRTDPTADTLDLLSIAGNILAGVWLRGASLQNVKLGNVNIGRGILIGQLATDSGTGVILNATYITRYQEILKLKDPKERTDNLVKLLQEAVLANGMLLISISSTVNDLSQTSRMKNPSEAIDLTAQDQQPENTTFQPLRNGNRVRSVHPEAEPTLTAALPRDLQGRIPINVDPDLPSNTVEVHYEVDTDGIVSDIYMKVGPDAAAIDIMLHVQTVRLMQGYSGLSGRIRILWERIRSWISKHGEPPVGTLAWEAKLEIEKLPRIIKERLQRLSLDDLDAEAQANIWNDIEYLEEQLVKYQRTLDEMDLNPGRGFVAALNGRPAKRGEAESYRYPSLTTEQAESYYYERVETENRNAPRFLLTRKERATGKIFSLELIDGQYQIVEKPSSRKRQTSTELQEERVKRYNQPATALLGLEEAIQAGKFSATIQAYIRSWETAIIEVNEILNKQLGNGNNLNVIQLIQGLSEKQYEKAASLFRNRLRQQIADTILLEPNGSERMKLLDICGDKISQPPHSNKDKGELFTVFRNKDFEIRQKGKLENVPGAPRTQIAGTSRNADDVIRVISEDLDEGAPKPGTYLVEDKSGKEPFDPAQAQRYSSYLNDGEGKIQVRNVLYDGLVYFFTSPDPALKAMIQDIQNLNENIYVAFYDKNGELTWLPRTLD